MSRCQIGVLVGNCDGFVGNRMLRWYTDETMFLLEEGASPMDVDKAVKSFGMGLGPLEMADVAGNDLSYMIRYELFLFESWSMREGGRGGTRLTRPSAVGSKLFCFQTQPSHDGWSGQAFLSIGTDMHSCRSEIVARTRLRSPYDRRIR